MARKFPLLRTPNTGTPRGQAWRDVANNFTELYASLDANAPSVGAGSVPSAVAAEVAVAESGSTTLHTTVLTLTAVPLEVISITTAAGVGGVAVYDFPEGHILRQGGAVADLSLGVETQADFTDGTPEGDVGIGTLAPANDDALGTDATDDDWGTATAFVMAAYVDPSITVPPDGTGSNDGTSSAISIFVNAFVDAADIDDGVTTNLLVSGTITLHWTNLGDY